MTVSLINTFLGNLSHLKFQVITEAIPDTVGGKLIGLVTSRAEIPELLKVNTTIETNFWFINLPILKIGTYSKNWYLHSIYLSAG